MTDITELAQSLKAAAENAIGAHERLAAYPYDEIIDISQHEGEQIDIDITDLNEFNKEANPENILALVEALEKAQAAERRWHRVASRIHEQACESDVKIDELEAIRAAAEKLVRCKGRYHSEQNYRALAALFGVTTPDLPPIDGESRAVKLPVGYTASSGHPFNEAERTVMIPGGGDWLNRFDVEHVLTAAGIKLEAE
ncbi:ead/Ea22-like family protein [Klebsiella pneumoniae]|uniref:ead/Ea22-like family protein n=1 Tax=Klebsiella pneumoniae TaxID=573 RepID=UPI001E37A260|nr:ead/Ea22-like family protein [Klebsiella pneumoniae]MCC7834049.1 ead/Ea22-like family protein [Klebsiella pneumoniae]